MKPSSRLRIWLASTALALYVAFVLVITLTQSPIDKPFRHDLDRLLEELHERGLPGIVTYGLIEFASNIAMFIPIGFIAALLLPRRWWWLVLLIGPLFSVAVELMQRTFLPERYATFSDVLANSIGVLIGALLAVILRALVAWRDHLLIDQALVDPGGRPLGHRVG